MKLNDLLKEYAREREGRVNEGGSKAKEPRKTERRLSKREAVEFSFRKIELFF